MGFDKRGLLKPSVLCCTFFAAVAILALAGCEDSSSSSSPRNIPVTGVTLDQAALPLGAGATGTLTAAVAPPNATDQRVSWSTSDSAVATVDAAGVVTAVAAGTVTITVTTTDGGKTADCAVTVSSGGGGGDGTKIPATGVTLDRDALGILLGGPPKTLTFTVEPEDATDKTVSWASSDPSVVTVENGIVTPVGPGTAVITVTTADGQTTTCEVTVTDSPIPVTGISLVPQALGLVVGDTGKLTAKVTPAIATDDAVEWTTGDSTVATVDAAGVVTALAPGTATITAANKASGQSADGEVTVSAVPVTGVSLDNLTLTIPIGSPEILRAAVEPANATNKEVSWESSDTAVATVDADGVVTPLTEGTAFIKVTSADDSSKSAICKVTVTIGVSGVSLNKSALSLLLGAAETLIATVAPATATNQAVTWASSNPAIAAVDTAGVVTPKGGGKAIITVTTVDGNKSASCEVTVTVPVTGVSLNKEDLSLPVGSSETLTPTVLPATASNKAVTWSSDDTDIATVNANGRVTAVDKGTATIRVTTVDGGYTAICEVTVIVAVDSVSLSPTSLSLKVGGANGTLTPTVAPGDATDKTVSWVSSNTSVALVSTNGVVTPVGAGTATITATTTNGKYGFAIVTVTVPVTAVSLQPSLTIPVGSTATLTPTVAPGNATDKTVSWASSNPTVAAVDGNGVVTALAPGPATITVTTVDGAFTASCAVTATPVAVTGVSLDETALSLLRGATKTLTPTVAPANATNKAVTWSATPAGIAAVDANGIVTAIAPGTATITVTTVDGGYSASCAVTVGPNVYVGGIHYGPSSAVMWKDGVKIDLSPQLIGSEIYSVYVSDGDVYAAGVGGATLGANSLVWKNGEQLYDLGSYTVAYSVYVSGGFVYVAGTTTVSGKTTATVWRDGTVLYQPPYAGTRESTAKSVFVSGSDVYWAGSEKNGSGIWTAMVWKNSAVERDFADGTISSIANSIFVSGSDVYVAGSKDGDAMVWRNSEDLGISYIPGGGSAAKSVYVDNGVVYAAGTQRDYGAVPYAAVWTDGTRVDLTIGEAYSVYVSGGDVYVAGYDFDSPKVATVWKNGEVFAAFPEVKTTAAYSVFVY